MRILLWFTAVAALVAIGLMSLLPGRAESSKVYLWPAEETPRIFQQALQQSGWTPSANRRYYFVSYMVRFRSLVPLGLNDLRGRVKKLPAGVRAHLYHQFPRRTGRFELIELDADFLLEVPPDQSPEEIVRHLDVAIVSGRDRWLEVPVRFTPEIELIRDSVFER